jgi:hypothetical protein
MRCLIQVTGASPPSQRRTSGRGDDRGADDVLCRAACAGSERACAPVPRRSAPRGRAVIPAMSANWCCRRRQVGQRFAQSPGSSRSCKPTCASSPLSAMRFPSAKCSSTSVNRPRNSPSPWRRGPPRWIMPDAGQREREQRDSRRARHSCSLTLARHLRPAYTGASRQPAQSSIPIGPRKARGATILAMTRRAVEFP